MSPKEVVAYLGLSEVEIEYVGSDVTYTTRIVGTNSRVWPVIFYGSLLTTLVAAVVLTIRTRLAEARPVRRRR